MGLRKYTSVPSAPTIATAPTGAPPSLLPASKSYNTIQFGDPETEFDPDIEVLMIMKSCQMQGSCGDCQQTSVAE